jgi:hypothetical protein
MKIIQIIPCSNVWIRLKNEDGAYRYKRAECLGLFESPASTNYIQYIFLDEKGYQVFDFEMDGIVYAERDLSTSTGFWDK